MSGNSAIIKVTQKRVLSYFGVPAEQQDLVIISQNRMSVKVGFGTVEIVGGQKDGEQILDGKIPANTKVKILPNVELWPDKYQVLVSANNKLGETGMFSLNSVVHPGQGSDSFAVFFKADKATDINQLGYFLQLALVD